ncbi:MAG TPA: DHA2 family efflux MFS transporter permease subunit [Agromyces sp.]|nr:DHA2 family efflux MFS transporter permease subunit [Agromyces sp.]
MKNRLTEGAEQAGRRAGGPASGRRRWMGLGVLVAGLSMIVLDGTIVGVALPTIITELSLDLSEAQWVNGIYSVVFAALLLTAGRVGDRLGRRSLFVVGLIVFMVGSGLAALSSDAGLLIAARLVQGLGGALILPSTLSTMNATFRGRDRAVAFGIWGAVISGVAALGPLLGGWLTTAFSWQWIFIVNIPVGIVILIAAFLFVDQTKAHITAPGIDVDGLLLSAIGFGGVVFALIEGASLGWWMPEADFQIFGWVWPETAPISIVPVVGTIGIAALVLFVLWERHRGRNGRSAILDLRLFRHASFTWGNVTALCVAIGEFGLLFVLPLYIVNAMGLTTLGAGLVLAAMGAGAFLSGALARRLSERFGATRVVTMGLVIEVVGVLAATWLVSPSVAPWLLAIVLAVYGLGLGLASAQLTGTVLADVPPEQSGQGSATQSTVRQVGSALGTAVIGAVLAAGLAVSLPQQLDGVDGVDAAAATQLETQTEQSAGSNLPGLRAQGTPDDVVDALTAGMTAASRAALLSAAGFLVLGLGSSLVLDRQAGRRPQRTPVE